MASVYITTDIDTENISVKYENIYAIDGELFYFTLNKDQAVPSVNKFTNASGWQPRIKYFQDLNEMDKYINSFVNKQTIELSVLGDNWWKHNALFDGFYPLYLALVKFNYINDDFVLLSDTWNEKQLIAYDIITKFSGNQMMDYYNLDKSKFIHFKTLVAGTGNTGNRVMNKKYTIYGEKEYNALSHFKSRMLTRHSINVDRPINTGSNINIIIIENKRYSTDELVAINKLIEYYKNIGINIKYVDWSKYPSFTEQMKQIEDADVHISGPGTGMMRMPFLKKGAVNINLGYMEHSQTNGARPNIFIKDCKYSDFIFPGWMEQSICSGASYVSTLYYDRINYNNLEIEPLIEITDKAISIVNNGFLLKNNLNIDAQIFTEYCRRSPTSDQYCQYLTNVAIYIELVICEHPLATSSDLLDIHLLRKIKDEFGYQRKYEY
jgi:hypothetical protein